MENSAEKNKKILCLIEGLGPGGAERQMIGLAQALKESGQYVSLMYFSPNHFYRHIAEGVGINLEYISCPQWIFLRIPILIRKINKYQPNVVISYLRTASLIACVAKCWQRDCRLIVSERNTSQKNNLKERIYFFLFKKADYIVSNSFCQTDFITNNFPTLQNKVFTIPNFVDEERFGYNINTNIDKDKSKNNKIRLICVGRIDKQKNIPRFLSAIRLVVDNGINIQIEWYGQEQNDIKITKKVWKELHLEDIVSFIPPVANIEKKYIEADALCLPSLFEGTPNVILEAMCCGIPVLCSDVCDNSRLVQNGVSGILFNPKDVRGIAEAIMTFSKMSEEERLSMGIAGHRFVSSAFSRSEFLNSYQKLLSKL